MQAAYFKNIRKEIIPLLNNAESEVQIAMAWFTSRELFEALLDCRERGVKVELVLLDNVINWMYFAPDFNLLIEAGGVIRIAKLKIGQMHHKFCVIDSKTAITGSYNWTYFAEKHNQENIIITDEKDIVQSFKSEFQYVTTLYLPSTKCRKLSWEEIENSNIAEDIDFYELNNEIGSYVDVFPTAERKVFKTTIKQVKTERVLPHSVVQEPIVQTAFSEPTQIITTPVENRFNPVSAFNIGIQATNEEGNDFYLMPIIKKGDKLPKIGSYTFQSYLETRDQLECKIFYGNSSDTKEDNLLTARMVKEITNGRNDEQLKILIQFTLNPNGVLYAEIRCLETGKATEITATNSSLVINKV